jgi:hypothetical protein
VIKIRLKAMQSLKVFLLCRKCVFMPGLIILSDLGRFIS